MRKTGVIALVFLFVVVMTSCHKVENSPAQVRQEAPAGSSEASAPKPMPDNAEASQPARAEEGSPRIVFDQKDFDFGKVEAGQQVENIFKFRNTGDGTLLIRDVRSS